MADLTPEMIAELRRTWAIAATDADAIAKLFYARLFDVDPTIREMFAGMDMEAQRAKLIAAIDAVICQVHEPAPLLPVLAKLGALHDGLGVERAHYNTVAASLLWTLERALGGAHRPETAEAWEAALTFVAEAMIQGTTKVAA